MEDRFTLIEKLGGTPLHLFAIYDGHGGEVRKQLVEQKQYRLIMLQCIENYLRYAFVIIINIIHHHHLEGILTLRLTSSLERVSFIIETNVNATEPFFICEQRDLAVYYYRGEKSKKLTRDACTHRHTDIILPAKIKSSYFCQVPADAVRLSTEVRIFKSSRSSLSTLVVINVSRPLSEIAFIYLQGRRDGHLLTPMT